MTSRHTSSPMKSAGCSGPIGWFRPTRHRCRCPRPSEASSARIDSAERHQDAVDDEPGPVGRHDDLLAHLGGQLADRRLVWSVCGRAADQLDERMTGTGLNACRRSARGAPLTPRRPGDRWRSSWCSSRRSWPAAPAVQLRQRAVLTPTSSKTASTTRSASATRARSSVATMRPWSRRARRPSACPWRPPARGCHRSDPDQRPHGEIRLVEHDLLSDRRVDLGDPVAHEPGAGDEDLRSSRVERSGPGRDRRGGAWRRTASSAAPQPATAADTRNAPS